MEEIANEAGELNLKKNRLIVMIKRGDEMTTPRGDTKILEEDIVVKM